MLRAGFCRVLLLRAPRRRFAAAEGSEPLPSTAAAGAAAEREPPPRMVTESEEVDLLPPAAGERPHKVARRSSGRSAALRQPPTVRPGAACPGLGSAHPSPPAGSAERAVFSFPSAFQVFPLLSSPFHSLTAMEKEKKKKKRGSQLKRPRSAEPCLLPNSPSLPPARPNYGQRRRAMGKGARFGLRNQQPARGSPLPILRIPPARSAYPGAGGGGEAEQGAAKFLPPSRRVAGLPCARGGDEPSGAGAARPQQVGSGTLLWSSPPTTHTPRSRVGRARGAAGSASPWGGTAPEISAHRATVTPPG